MATISPALTVVAGVPRITWTGVSTADTMTAYALAGGRKVHGAYQITGTFGSATIKLQVSNDGTNFVDMKDVNNATITGTAAGMFEFSTSAGYLKPASSGGTADNVDVTLILRN